MEGYIALFVALVTVAVGVYHYKIYPEKYTITSKFQKYWPDRPTRKPNPAGAGIGIIFVVVFFLSAYLLSLNIVLGSAVCILILFVDYKILKKIRKF